MSSLFINAHTGEAVDYCDLRPEWVGEVLDNNQNELFCRDCLRPVRFYSTGEFTRWACDCSNDPPSPGEEKKPTFDPETGETNSWSQWADGSPCDASPETVAFYGELGFHLVRKLGEDYFFAEIDLTPAITPEEIEFVPYRYQVDIKYKGSWVERSPFISIKNAIKSGNGNVDRGESARIIDLKTGSVIWEVNL